jgi:hypothetical protein
MASSARPHRGLAPGGRQGPPIRCWVLDEVHVVGRIDGRRRQPQRQPEGHRQHGHPGEEDDQDEIPDQRKPGPKFPRRAATAALGCFRIDEAAIAMSCVRRARHDVTQPDCHGSSARATGRRVLSLPHRLTRARTRCRTSSGMRTVRYTRRPFLGKLITMTPGSWRNSRRTVSSFTFKRSATSATVKTTSGTEFVPTTEAGANPTAAGC